MSNSLSLQVAYQLVFYRISRDEKANSLTKWPQAITLKNSPRQTEPYLFGSTLTNSDLNTKHKLYLVPHLSYQTFVFVKLLARA